MPKCLQVKDDFETPRRSIRMIYNEQKVQEERGTEFFDRPKVRETGYSRFASDAPSRREQARQNNYE